MLFSNDIGNSFLISRKVFKRLIACSTQILRFAIFLVLLTSAFVNCSFPRLPGGMCSLQCLKDVRAHCYCASLVRTLFTGHARATSFSSARTDSKTQQKKRMTFALTWCANIFVGCSVTPTFFSGRSLPFLTLFIILKNKKNLCGGSFNYFSYTIDHEKWVEFGTWIQVCVT